MGSIRCPCGEVISDADVPSPYLHHLVADTALETLVTGVRDAAKGNDPDVHIAFLIAQTAVPTYQCPASGHLLVFWNGLDRPSHAYRPETETEADGEESAPPTDRGSP